MDRISRTTRPKATIRTPSELAKTASGGRPLYAAEPLAPPFLWKRLFHFITDENKKCVHVIMHHPSIGVAHRAKKSFSLIPEMQAMMLSDRMLPPNHTWAGLSSLRSDAGDQGSRKATAPATHCIGGDRNVKDRTKTPALTVRSADVPGERRGLRLRSRSSCAASIRLGCFPRSGSQRRRKAPRWTGRERGALARRAAASRAVYSDPRSEERGTTRLLYARQNTAKSSGSLECWFNFPVGFCGILGNLGSILRKANISWSSILSSEIFTFIYNLYKTENKHLSRSASPAPVNHSRFCRMMILSLVSQTLNAHHSRKCSP